jgi:hypothetical protein
MGTTGERFPIFLDVNTTWKFALWLSEIKAIIYWLSYRRRVSYKMVELQGLSPRSCSPMLTCS